MPRTIEYPRTSYLSAWEVAEVVDDFGGKCSIEACARKLNRKVSGSFKAILGSAVKFGLLTSKREMLTTTNLMRRIKNAYDKTEEKIYHREAFLHPPLFSHICRKFRNRELPVHMFDVMLIREFNVEEINAQNVAKAFVEGARMVDVLDERNVIADIDQLTKPAPRRDLASPEMKLNLFGPDGERKVRPEPSSQLTETGGSTMPIVQDSLTPAADAIASLFGFGGRSTTPAEAPTSTAQPAINAPATEASSATNGAAYVPTPEISPLPTGGHVPPMGINAPRQSPLSVTPTISYTSSEANLVYSIHISGPGMDTHLTLQDESDLIIVQALLEKIRKQFPR